MHNVGCVLGVYLQCNKAFEEVPHTMVQSDISSASREGEKMLE